MTCLANAAGVDKHVVWVGITLGCLAWSSPVSAHNPKPRLILLGHTAPVQCVAFSPDGKTLASGGGDNTIRFWDVASGKQRAIVKNAAEYWVDSVAFSPDVKTLASGIGGSGVKLYDVRTRKPRTLRDKVSQYARPLVVFSPDGKTLASGGPCIRKIRLWNVATGKKTITLKGHDEYGVHALAFKPDGKIIASVGHDGVLKFWDLATGKTQSTRTIAEWTPAAAISPGGKMVATAICVDETTKGKNALTDNSIMVWDAATGKEQAALKGHTNVVRRVVFSPDGKRLASAGQDHTIKVWDVAKGRELATLKEDPDEVLCLAFSADGKKLACGGEDKTIKIWDTPKVK